MDNLLYTYALIKSLNDEGENFLDAFWPFTLQVIPENDSVKIDFIQYHTYENFNLKIPLHVLTSILNRAKILQYISYSNNKYRLTDSGRNYRIRLESEKEIERKINWILDDIRLFFESKSIKINNDDIRRLLEDFLKRNIEPLLEFFNQLSSVSSMRFDKPNHLETILIEYIKEVENRKPEQYSILNNMVFGSLICSILYSPEPQEFIKKQPEKFKNFTLYLDTNFVFSLLELHTSEYNRPAIELFHIIKEFNFKLKIFNFTVDEICRVLNNYGSEAYLYPTTIRIDSIYSSLKTKGWTKFTARRYIANIEETLKEKGILIDWDSSIQINNFVPRDPTIISKFFRYKPMQLHQAQIHDIAAIEAIQKIRRKEIRNFKESIAIFLTSDRGLFYLNFIEFNHKGKGTIPEIFLDRIFTSILWLNNPKINLSLSSIIAAHSRNLFVKRRIWDRFYNILHELKKEGKITDEDISLILLDNQLEIDLKNIDESEMESITPKFAIDEIEKLSKHMKDKQLSEFQLKEKEFLEKLNTEKNSIEKAKDAEWLSKIEIIKNNFRLISQKKARKLIMITKISVILIVIFAAIIIHLFISWLFSLIPIVILLFLVLGIHAGKIDNYWDVYKQILFEYYFEQMNKNLELN